jgi:hypothetical protein
MKRIAVLICLFITACNTSPGNKSLSVRVDSLEKKLATTYKPGLGEFMSNIQVHHAKLWFAGNNQNWELADFEIHEIIESIENIKKYETDRPETKLIPLIDPPLDSVSLAIQKKDATAFKNSYLLLTNTCNNCHREVNYSFNEVKVPEQPPFSNQVFKRSK